MLNWEGPPKLSVRGDDATACAAVEAVLRLYAVLLDTRAVQAWQAIDLLRAGSTHARAAATLGITRQAVGSGWTPRGGTSTRKRYG